MLYAALSFCLLLQETLGKMSDENQSMEAAALAALPNVDPVLGMLVRYTVGALKLKDFEVVGTRGMIAVATSDYKPSLRVAEMFPDESDVANHSRRVAHFRNTFLESLVVFETTIFEAFIDEATTYLITENPGKHLKGVAIDIGELLGDTRANVIRGRIAQRARQIAFEELVRRLDFLREKFALEFDLLPEEREAIKKWSLVRNEIVHSTPSWTLHICEPMRWTPSFGQVSG